MYAVIAGGGKIGRYIARDLAHRGHEVTVLERVPERCRGLLAEADVLVIEGDACDVRTMVHAHLDRADVFVATTHEDDDNLVACQLARAEFKVPRVISRVNSPKNVEIFERLGVEGVSSTRLISELLENEFTVGELIHLYSLKGGRISLVEVRIPGEDEPDAPLPRFVSDLELPLETVLVAMFRDEQTIIPRGTTRIEPGDAVIALCSPELEERLKLTLLGKRP